MLLAHLHFDDELYMGLRLLSIHINESETLLRNRTTLLHSEH